MCFLYFIAISIGKDLVFGFMYDDKNLKFTLNEVVTYVVKRMESESKPENRKCIFQEYKEWLGPSIDDWVLALPNNWGKSDANFY